MQVVPPAATQVISPVATQVVSPTATQPVSPAATQVIPTAATQIVSPAATQVIPAMATQVISPVAPVLAPVVVQYPQPGPAAPQASPDFGPQAYRRPLVPKRTGLLLAFALPFVLAAAQAPLITVGCFAVVVIIARIIGTIVNDLHTRRELAGYERKSDSGIVAARAPLALLRGVLGAIPQLLVGGFAGLLVMAAGWWAFGAGRIMILERADAESVAAGGLNAPIVFAGVLAVAMAALMAVTWFGTHSALTRYGARVALNGVAPLRYQAGAVRPGGGTTVVPRGRVGVVTVLLAVVALAVAALLFYRLFSSPVGAISWWPASAPPSL